MKVGQGIKSLFLWEFVRTIGLSMRYFFAPKKIGRASCRERVYVLV